ncbi:hypothetical protein NDU88_004794, partial [Pleurodeles waltl]
IVNQTDWSIICWEGCVTLFMNRNDFGTLPCRRDLPPFSNFIRKCIDVPGPNCWLRRV